jgi:RNA polymerase sigma-70 factor, ECF subfamily
MTTCLMERDRPAARLSLAREKRNVTLLEYLLRIGSGDESAMATFYDETRTMVYSQACRVLGVMTDAQEVTLDVYLQVWRTAAHYDARRGTVAAWLLMMARSRAIDRLRSVRKSPVQPQSLDEHPGLAATDPDPEQTNLANAERARVRSALRTLSPEQRLAIQMTFFRGLTHRELAEQLGEPLGTVKTRIRSALHRLRAALDEDVRRVA